MQTRVLIREDRLVVVIETSPSFHAMSLAEKRRMVEEALTEAMGQVSALDDSQLSPSSAIEAAVA